jgi:pimeloyl-ACP methyl ester carboxylesterase
MHTNKRFIVDYRISGDTVESNELLILEPETDVSGESILFFHGHQVGMRIGAWETPRYLLPLIENGYRVIVPSVLGYGKTTGNPDYCGPDTLKRIEQTIHDMIDSPLHVIGASRGGTLAVLFAEHYPDLTKSCTAIAGTYDLEKLVNETSDVRMRENIINETGGSKEAYKVRDPKSLWQKLKSPLHIVHGEKDDQIPVSQAEEFVSFLQSQDLQPKLTKLDNAGHKLFSKQVFEETIIPFLKQS